MNLTDLLQRFAELLRRPPVTWWDVLDILVVSILIYELLKLIRGTRAVQMAVGIASIVGLFYLSRGLHLETLNWLIRNIIGYVVFAAIVLLQGRHPAGAGASRARPVCSGASIPKSAMTTGRGAGGGGDDVVGKEDWRDRGDRAVRSACATTSRAGSRSMPSSPTTCWSAFFSRLHRCTTAP
jgi:hypothetical protein